MRRILPARAGSLLMTRAISAMSDVGALRQLQHLHRHAGQRGQGGALPDAIDELSGSSAAFTFPAGPCSPLTPNKPTAVHACVRRRTQARRRLRWFIVTATYRLALTRVGCVPAGALPLPDRATPGSLAAVSIRPPYRFSINLMVTERAARPNVTDGQASGRAALTGRGSKGKERYGKIRHPGRSRFHRRAGRAPAPARPASAGSSCSAAGSPGCTPPGTWSGSSAATRASTSPSSAATTTSC